MKSIILLTLLCSTFVYASKTMKYAPNNFSCNGGMCTYIDFETANYKITYNLAQKTVNAESTILFISKSDGMPLFDLVPDIKNNIVLIDGKEVAVSSVKDPDGQSTLRVANIVLSKGPHEMKLKHKIKRGFVFDSMGVSSAFWMSDLSNRGYLERYLPTNAEFDQYQINFEVEILNYAGSQNIFTNGNVVETGKNKWKISYPKYFTASSLFFHTAPKGVHKMINFDFQSRSGKTIPIQVYAKSSRSLDAFKTKTLAILKEYESDFIPWPHPSLLIYAAGLGGMEYAGATMTSMRALGHEINHSYFARGIMPSRGNNGWIDEAIASWRDDGYRTARRASAPMGGLGSHSQYRRHTDRGAYSKGARFMESLDFIFKNQGGLKAFLADLVEKKMYQSINTKEFQKLAEQFHGRSLSYIFNQTIYGKDVKWKKAEVRIENPYHPVVSEADLKALL